MIPFSVLVGPDILITKDTEKGDESDQTVFKCNATGNPTPTVVWKIGDEQIADQEVT